MKKLFTIIAGLFLTASVSGQTGEVIAVPMGQPRPEIATKEKDNNIIGQSSPPTDSRAMQAVSTTRKNTEAPAKGEDVLPSAAISTSRSNIKHPSKN